jgi:hypothetical protein
VNVTLAYRYALLEALRYSRAWSSFASEKADLESNPAFISWALPAISSDTLQKGEVSQGNSLFDDVAVIF